jgi:hypothetical protein
MPARTSGRGPLAVLSAMYCVNMTRWKLRCATVTQHAEHRWTNVSVCTAITRRIRRVCNSLLFALCRIDSRVKSYISLHSSKSWLSTCLPFNSRTSSQMWDITHIIQVVMLKYFAIPKSLFLILSCIHPAINVQLKNAAVLYRKPTSPS